LKDGIAWVAIDSLREVADRFLAACKESDKQWREARDTIHSVHGEGATQGDIKRRYTEGYRGKRAVANVERRSRACDDAHGSPHSAALGVQKMDRPRRVHGHLGGQARKGAMLP
jgi:hypothetical protein